MTNAFTDAKKRVEIAFNLPAFMNDVKLKSGLETVRDIGDACGTSASTISRMFNGKIPDIDTFMRMCAAFQLEPGNYFDKQVWRLDK